MYELPGGDGHRGAASAMMCANAKAQMLKRRCWEFLCSESPSVRGKRASGIVIVMSQPMA